ncbi:hypothetical protein TNCT6_76980 [Streptomyces sp. 6-11-2]|nr:hypothetical protein TNCT6_76980 [Streptomyces sp. 6-11-2]
MRGPRLSPSDTQPTAPHHRHNELNATHKLINWLNQGKPPGHTSPTRWKPKKSRRLAKHAYRDFGKSSAEPPLVLLNRYQGTIDHRDPALLDVLDSREPPNDFSNDEGDPLRVTGCGRWWRDCEVAVVQAASQSRRQQAFDVTVHTCGTPRVPCGAPVTMSRGLLSTPFIEQAAWPR